MTIPRWVRIYLIPGAVFQSVLVGGGYGTGREVIEYFTQYGFVGGLAAMVVSLLVFALVLALTFEIARKFSAYDYRHFFKQILGPFWFVYELIAVVMLMLVFAVLMAASGEVLEAQFGISMMGGIALMVFLVAALEFYGREAVTRVLTLWSLVLYAVFFAFLWSVLGVSDVSLGEQLDAREVKEGWGVSGFKYAMYNMTGAPIILFVARAFKSRSEAMGSGLVAAVLALIPALMFHIAFIGAGDELLSESIPVYATMEKLGLTVLAMVFTVMLFGTLIETAAGTMQGINERIEGYREDKVLKPLARGYHALIAIGIMGLSAAVAQVGIAQLVGRGYGYIAWAFFLVYFIPLITVGLIRVLKR